LIKELKNIINSVSKKTGNFYKIIYFKEISIFELFS